MKLASESHHQKKVVAYLTFLKINKQIVDFLAIENENKHSKGTLKDAIMEKESKAMGKNVGASDLIIIGFDKVLFLEMKDAPRQLKTKLSISHTKKSHEQIVFIENVGKSKVCQGVFCYGYDEAKKFIDDCFNIKAIL